ncbi:MAG: hypothetical protein ACKOOA_12130, partial [Sediminibacterium sp.]
MNAFAHSQLLKFLLLDVHQLPDLFRYPRYAHLDEEQAWMMVESAKQLADRDMAPYFRIMDEQPAQHDGKGGVKT